MELKKYTNKAGLESLKNHTPLRNDGGPLSGLQRNELASLVHFVVIRVQSFWRRAAGSRLGDLGTQGWTFISRPRGMVWLRRQVDINLWWDSNLAIRAYNVLRSLRFWVVAKALAIGVGSWRMRESPKNWWLANTLTERLQRQTVSLMQSRSFASRAVGQL